ncbi:hypothetical protein DUNSADRAFT_3521 [Dunaliella salina]|uniref:Encoded protein n=1 Tax=Dunaliella salina TaxID=3046 RepID=A0ABQ7FVR4_DUNSA|nr:hypothetical protein DUNSADRAFT_3521 [Dunaliella salina]|eukprot:KAF5826331.1 hypothetical protein DUNSADRAFT_3521 [Dunaliella salina]
MHAQPYQRNRQIQRTNSLCLSSIQETTGSNPIMIEGKLHKQAPRTRAMSHGPSIGQGYEPLENFGEGKHQGMQALAVAF